MASVGFKEPEKPHKASLNFSLPLDSMDEGDDDLNQRIEDFKYHNPDDVDELRKCIQEVLCEAEKTVQDRLDRKAVSLKFIFLHTVDIFFKIYFQNVQSMKFNFNVYQFFHFLHLYAYQNSFHRMNG